MYTRNRYNRRRATCPCDTGCRNCKMPDVMPKNPQLANSYVPYQYLQDTFCPMESLAHGTTFPELVSPYEPNQSQCVLQYLMGTQTCVQEGGGCYE